MRAAGFDVSKKELAASWDGHLELIPNDAKRIRRYLNGLPAGTLLGVESTGRHHMKLVEVAIQMGMAIYVVNPREFFLYRKSLSFRVKSDPSDAELLARFIENEHERLRPYKRPSDRCLLGTELIRHRDGLVRALVSLRESMAQLSLSVRDCLVESQRALEQLNTAIESAERELAGLMEMDERYKRILKMPGIGPITAAAIILAFDRGTFPKADSLVAYAGLDLEVADSGIKKGRRRLTKRGDRLLRCLLYLAATAGTRCECWRGYYQKAKERGWKPVQAILILARKMLRTAWALLRYEREFDPCQANT